MFCLNHQARMMTLFSSLLLTAIFSLSLYAIASPVTAVTTAVIIHVDVNTPSGSPDGMSWDTAFASLQDGLAAATKGTEIWVAQGVYPPGNTISDTFVLTDGVAIYGGFAATETLRTQRNYTENLTILSGDIDGDDITTNGVVMSTTDQAGDNSYHVVFADGVTNTAVLDGFTITGGQADGGFRPSFIGGGIYINESNITLNNLIVSGNTAFQGGGIANINSNPTLNNIRHFGNFARRNGGGILNTSSSPVLNNVDFAHNAAYLDGGGMYNSFDSDPKITNVNFLNNSAISGGGMYNSPESNPILNNVNFSNNSATSSGGGMYDSSKSNSILNNVNFSNNSATYGGGMHNIDNNVLLNNTSFVGNVASILGGGIYNRLESTPILNNVLISGNSAEKGGGIYSQFSEPRLSNVSISGNSAEIGGGIYNLRSSPTVVNTIVWRNEASGSADEPSASIFNDNSTPIFTYSIIEHSGNSEAWNTDIGINGGNNLDSDPLFVTTTTLSNIPASIIGHLSLQPNSPAIDAGNTVSYTNMNTVTTDIIGNTRVFNTVIDIGAYEFVPFHTLAITIAGTGLGVITSDPAGIDCGITCTTNVMKGTLVTLTATAEASSIFSGWSGASSSNDTTITVTMGMTQSITATFEVETAYYIYLPFLTKPD